MVVKHLLIVITKICTSPMQTSCIGFTAVALGITDCGISESTFFKKNARFNNLDAWNYHSALAHCVKLMSLEYVYPKYHNKFKTYHYNVGIYVIVTLNA